MTTTALPISNNAFTELTDSDVFTALRKTWQPVCLARHLREKRIVSYVLLNQEIVIADLPTGLLAARDLCPHRGAKFGLGTIVGGNLQCPYHGWQFDKCGSCAKIPSLIDPHTSLKQVCLTTFEVVERYGLIWVKLDRDQAASLPDVGEFEDSRWTYVVPEPMIFGTGFRRELDNYLDMSHFAFAHKNTLGVAAREQITDITITHFDDGFQMDAPFPALSNTDEPPGKLQSSHLRRQRCHLPNFTTIRQTFSDGDERVLVHIPSPNTATRCTVFWALAISPNFNGPPAEKQIEFAIRVLDEDRIMVENQRPLEVPIGREDAVMVPADRLANTYKSAIREFVRLDRDGPGELVTEGSVVVNQTIKILYGSQTGGAERLAHTAGKILKRAGFDPHVAAMDQIHPAQLTGSVLILCSTYGNGDPPDNARAFYDFLFESEQLDLSPIRFAVLAMGDKSYPNFCQCGRDLDRRIDELGGKRLLSRIDCDVRVDEPFSKWLQDVQGAFRNGRPQHVITLQDDDLLPGFSASKPLKAYVVENRLLSLVGSSKETRHYEMDISATGLVYQPGDAVGIVPTNSPELVELIIRLLDENPDRATDSGKTFRQALLTEVELRKPSLSLVQWVVERMDQTMPIDFKDRDGLIQIASTNDVLSLLEKVPSGALPGGNVFLELCEPIRPRLYSIASSPLSHPGSIHLTVSTIRYELGNRTHHGVSSTFLADRVRRHDPVPMFIKSNSNFRLPEDLGADIIMIGPGTGIAPFRGFLYHRHAQQAKGRNWLFFGDQRAATDYLYSEELQQWHQDGLLTRLSTAFSRDQVEKAYVQDRMHEEGRLLFEWLEAGATLYICGDSKRMARSVDQALHEIVARNGKMSPLEAGQYIKALQHQGKYKRDVY